jgi:hypothetical protein
MFKDNVTPGLAALATKPEATASKKKETTGRTAKLKSSKWYQHAAQSIGIAKETSHDDGDDFFRHRH